MLDPQRGNQVQDLQSPVAECSLNLSRNNSQQEDTNDPVWYKKKERPVLWIILALLVIIIIDALIERIFDVSLMNKKHWLVLRFLAIVLSIIVFY